MVFNPCDIFGPETSEPTTPNHEALTGLSVPAWGGVIFPVFGIYVEGGPSPSFN